MSEEIKKIQDELLQQMFEGNINVEKLMSEYYSRDTNSTFNFMNDFTKLKLKFQNNSTNPDPEYAKKSDSGFDLRANLDSPISLMPLGRALIPTGLFFEIPDGYEIQVRPRSGLAISSGITVLNTPGTVDAGYRGEIKVILINLSDKLFTVNHGDKIAQAVLTNVATSTFTELIKIDKVSQDTERSDGGFGSTGNR